MCSETDPLGAAVVVVNEFNETVLFHFVSKPEGYKEIRPLLQGLSKRCEALGTPVRDLLSHCTLTVNHKMMIHRSEGEASMQVQLIYVDNVRAGQNILRDCFPTVGSFDPHGLEKGIKQDPIHMLWRITDLLAGPKGKIAGRNILCNRFTNRVCKGIPL